MSHGVLDQIHKCYVKPHLEYGGVIYHKYNPKVKLESTKYSAGLAVSGACRGPNTYKINEELNWEIICYRRWQRRLCHFYKLQSDQRPLYVYNEISHVPSVTVYRRPNKFESYGKALSDLLTLISKMVLENGTN